MCSRHDELIITATFALGWPAIKVNFNDFDTNKCATPDICKWLAMEVIDPERARRARRGPPMLTLTPAHPYLINH